MTDIKNTSVIDFEDISDEQMNAMIDGTLTEFDEGDLVDGTVVKIEHDEVLVDIGFKSEGVIPSRELSIRKDADPSDIVELGEKIEALVLQKEDKDGRLILSKKRAEYERPAKWSRARLSKSSRAASSSISACAASCRHRWSTFVVSRISTCTWASRSKWTSPSRLRRSRPRRRPRRLTLPPRKPPLPRLPNSLSVHNAYMKAGRKTGLLLLLEPTTQVPALF